jgi:hypothetical protein
MKEIKWSRKLSVDDRRAYDLQQLEKRKAWKTMKAAVVAKRNTNKGSQNVPPLTSRTGAAPTDGPSLKEMRSIKDPAARTVYWAKHKAAIIEQNAQSKQQTRSSERDRTRDARILTFREQAIAKGYTI